MARGTDTVCSPTPGTWQWYWRVEDGVPNCGVFSEKREGQAYAIARCPRYESREQWVANARLIAAAPDLLDALQALHDLYANTWDRVDGALVMMGSGVEKFEAAHAKAMAAIEKANK